MTALGAKADTSLFTFIALTVRCLREGLVQNASVKEFCNTLIRYFCIIASIPFLVGLIAAFWHGLGFVLFIFLIPTAAIILIAGTLMWLTRGVRFAKEANQFWDKVVFISISPVLFVLTILISWPLLFVGGYLGDLVILAANQSHYETIIADVDTNRKAAWFEDDDGVTYSVDLGPPIRVAFNQAGFLDNWSGIIFDPTGEMMQADGFDADTGRFSAPDRITKLFGGDLVECHHLWGDYYACSFT